MASDPKGTLYLNSENIAWYTSIIEQPRPGPGKVRLTFKGYNKFRDADGYPATAPPWGTLQAIDMNTGKYKWKIPFGYYPELADKTTGTESYGGPVVTANGLLIIGAMSRLNWMGLKSIREGSWLDRLRARKPKMLVAIALANKMARMVWAMMAKGERYKEPIALAA